MDKEFMELIQPTVSSGALRELIATMLRRCDDYAQMQAEANAIGAVLQAKRKGITVEQFKEWASKIVAKQALRPDEKERFHKWKVERVATLKTDTRRLETILVSEKVERDNQEQMLSWKKLDPQLRALCQARVEFLRTNRGILMAFAESNGWSMPPGY